jgi:hypothetical protein
VLVLVLGGGAADRREHRLVLAVLPRADLPAVRDFTAEVSERLPAAAGNAAPR